MKVIKKASWYIKYICYCFVRITQYSVLQWNLRRYVGTSIRHQLPNFSFQGSSVWNFSDQIVKTVTTRRRASLAIFIYVITIISYSYTTFPLTRQMCIVQSGPSRNVWVDHCGASGTVIVWCGLECWVGRFYGRWTVFGVSRLKSYRQRSNLYSTYFDERLICLPRAFFSCHGSSIL